jgi:hypothetical protein
MNKTTLLLASVAALALTTPTFAADKDTYNSQTKVESDANGNYKESDKTEKTDASGTHIQEKKVDVDTDGKGNTDKSVTTKKVHKKGWFKKHSVKTKDTENTKSDGTVSTTHKKVVNGTTVEDSNRTATPQQ